MAVIAWAEALPGVYALENLVAGVVTQTEVALFERTFDYYRFQLTGTGFAYTGNTPNGGTVTGFTLFSPTGQAIAVATAVGTDLATLALQLATDPAAAFTAWFGAGSSFLGDPVGDDALHSYNTGDTLDGRAGDDTLSALHANVSLIGGTGNDTFILTTSQTITQLAGRDADGLPPPPNTAVETNTLRLAAGGSRDINLVTNLTDIDFDVAGSLAFKLDGANSWLPADLAIETTGTFGTSTMGITHVGNSAANLNYANWVLTGGDLYTSIRTATGLYSDAIIAPRVGFVAVNTGAGNDTITVANLSFFVLGGDGTDFLILDISGSWQTATIDLSMGLGRVSGNAEFEGIERIAITSGSGNDVITGGLLADTILGAAGRDMISGGGGVDVINGGEGVDILSGDAGNDTILGGTGNDFIDGGADNDTLDGGLGIDLVAGATGNDLYIVDSPRDMLTEDPNEGVDTVRTILTWTLDDDFEVLELVGTLAANGTGNGLANLLTGNGSNNVLDGRGMGDLMRGMGGNDTYIVDHAGDVVDEAAGTGTDLVISAVNFSLSDAVRAKGTIENLTLSGAAAVGTGNAAANTIIGTAGANTLSGMGGNDVLAGGLGSDVFRFELVPNGVTNFDRITDFNVAADTMALKIAAFAAIGAALTANEFVVNLSGLAGDGDDRVVYDRDSGNLFYDANGSLAGGPVLFATVGINLALTAADFIMVA